MILTTHEGVYKIKTFHAKVAYFSFLAFGGSFLETGANGKFKALFIFLTSYTLVVAAGGPTLYLLLHLHDGLTTTHLIFVGLTICGATTTALGQLLFLIYRDPIKASIKSIDDHFFADLVGQRATDDGDETMSVTAVIYSMVGGGVFGYASYVGFRLLGIAITGSQNMTNMFFQLSPLPLEFVEKRYGLATAYWLAYFLVGVTATYIIAVITLCMVMVGVICSATHNHFLYLRSWINEESRESTRILEKRENDRDDEVRESEAKNVGQRYIQYIQCYQKLIREINNAREYTEVIYSLLFLGMCTSSVPTGVLIITNEAIPIYTLSSLFFMVLVGIVFIIIFSYIGTRLAEINTKIMTSMYETPWIHLNPKQRANLIIFMSLLQKPITLKLAKIRPATMAMVVRFFQLNYTVINFIRMKTVK